jgi:hypothetical protein
MLVLVAPVTFASANAPVASRSFSPATYTPGVPIEVTITVTPDPSNNVYIVDECLPAGWTATNMSPWGIFWSSGCPLGGDLPHIDWPLQEGPDLPPNSFTYTATAPVNATGAQTFNGTVTYDAGLQVITGGAATIDKSAGTVLLCDDFSTNTTASYNATYWPYYGASATPSILYDAPNQQAILQGVGGYGDVVMEKNGQSPISAGSDFAFSADLSILSEFNGYLYIGDNRPIPPVAGTGTGVRFNIGTYMGYNCDLEIYQDGVSVADIRETYTPQSSNHLLITRAGSVYSFYVNNVLFWQQTVLTLDGMDLYWGVGNEISSGPSGITAQTAVDNICLILPDSDGDGVPDGLDLCPNTPPGAIVNTNGCSIAQLVPCAGPRSGGTWRNHGEYVLTVIETATDFLKADLITRREWAQIVSRAARSKCGWNRRCDHGWDRDWNRDWDLDHDRGWNCGDTDHDRNRQHNDSDRR